MRLAGGVTFVIHSAAGLSGASPIGVATAISAVASGACLVAGLWTPVAGLIMTTLCLWSAVTHADAPLANLLFATIAFGLALVGPGAWSIDARVFGWRRIDVGERDF